MVDLTNLESIMNLTMDDLPEPVVLTNGRYRFLVTRAKMTGPLGKNNIYRADFQVKPVDVVEGDMDPDDLPNADNVRCQYWLTDKSLRSPYSNVNIFKFFEVLGLDFDGSTKVTDLMEATVNREFEGTTTREERSDKDPSPVAAVDRVFEAE